ncbi:MAG: hypothetical protein COV29_03870 [Candidatus Yanofskybacteria bacterium CG10_big_fil_rev_8_21_14_0_10_36_16]|uniref:Uncharacterized protein n=1 Tax=Candidatus Yanofskybacteria bacterium CG10_big_fil_rev_8_21_14_0_10_36_16 TaxID=1975096 RepID=A0A2J0Q6N0_9BACT|nr:MAG: hypothetical protein COV29_03870 [Candidatus Yanofskybacteria bacterium CG10_big_fil_rev_8_21_14_0_10_36_16]
MYIPGVGSCSTFIHLIAQYPKVAAGIGLLATIGIVTSPVGPGKYAGSEKILENYEISLVSGNLAMDETKINDVFESVASQHNISNENIAHILKTCEKCSDIELENVLADDNLYKKVAYLYFLDLVHKNDGNLEKAAKAFLIK